MPDLSEMRHEVIKVTPIAQNCSLYWDATTGRGVVIDPGGDVSTILSRVAANGVQVDAILLTHAHFDHAGGADELRESLSKAGTPVQIIGPSKEDEFLLSQIEDSGRHFGIPGMRNFAVDRYVEDGETVSLAGRNFEVFHVPGHTPGHVVFVDRVSRKAFVGDTLFRGTVGRTDFAYGDAAQLLKGIVGKLLPLGDDVMIVPGHGGISTIADERRSNPYLQTA